MKLPLVLLAVLAFIGAGLVLQPPAPQARAAQLVIEIDMYGGENVPPVETLVWGFVRFFFSDDRLAADYTVDVKGVSGNEVVSADIRRGARGVNGPVVRHLADGGFITFGGRTTFSQAEVQEMMSGGWYVSLATVTHPEGQIRGQVVLPPNFLSADAPSTGQMPGLGPTPVGQRPNVTPTAAVPAPTATPVQLAPQSPPPADLCAGCELAPRPPDATPAAPPPPSAPTATFVIRPPNTGNAGLR